MKVRGRAGHVAPRDYQQRAVALFEKRIALAVATWEQTGAIAPPEEEIAALGPQVVTTDEELDAELGPFYSTSGVRQILGITRQAVDERRKAGTILAGLTSDREWVYPTFQFSGNAVHPGLAPAIRALKSADSWAAMLWFTIATSDLADQSPLEWIADGRDPDAVTTVAKRTAQDWR